ncbi:MAG TPA: peptidylprolyl isomerase [Verrucomicrobiae bacterium]|jgi:parvulin-like peptidyl-prolyl isomerase|nr:peptidylprolyl isomerase [Verrucomicrobiae bacterium]
MRFLFSILVLAIGFLAGFHSSAEPEIADRIAVVVHDSLVTSQQVEDYTAPLIDDLRRQFRGDPQGYQKKLYELLNENTEILVQRELILHEFETAGYSLPESVIDNYVQQRIRSRYGDRATLTKSLQKEGITFEKFRQQIRDQFIVEQMRLKNVADAVLISPHKIEVYYVTHTNDFKVEEQVKLRMIILNKTATEPDQARKIADEILEKLNEGASFAEMASVYSQDSKRAQGGAWDWVEKSVLRKDLADVAFNLKPGEKSGVIETPEACYLMLVEDRRPAHIKPLNDVRAEIEKTLLGEEQDRLQQQWNERLKKKTFIRYF